MCEGLSSSGYNVGGFDAYTTSDVLKGSGLSSSAAFEVMVGNIMRTLYENDVDDVTIAKLAQYAENKYFGKPCGLMDQTACAVGGFISIDFEDPKNPIVGKPAFDLSALGYSLCIVNTGGNHADLNADYASVPAEMKQVAAHFGKEVLRGITLGEIISAIPALREKTGDRAIMRAIHFVNENERVTAQSKALAEGNLSAFFDGVRASGNSSFKFLQNVYTVKNVEEQGLSLALAVTEDFLAKLDQPSACRVHGGGFAGTIQAFMPESVTADYAKLMDSVFGEGATYILRIRNKGAICVY
jgi:galactokinase